MSDVIEPMIHEDQLPDHESKLEPEPDWEPRYAQAWLLHPRMPTRRLPPVRPRFMRNL